MNAINKVGVSKSQIQGRTLDFTVGREVEALEKLLIVLVHQEVAREGLQRVLTMQEDDSISLEKEVLGRSSTATSTANTKTSSG